MREKSVRKLCVLQHTEAEYLGRMEDHLENRAISFGYARPFVPGGAVPPDARGYDGLVVLGTAPYGVTSGPLLPSLGAEIRLVRDFLARRLPVIGFGTGATLLCIASGGGAEEAALKVEVGEVRRVDPEALSGHLPAAYLQLVCMRDRPVLPADATILARDAAGDPALFAVRENCLGFAGHPGIKAGMLEDLILAFDAMPEESTAALVELRARQTAFSGALGDIMIGIMKATGLMDAAIKSA
jgi:GMP synthase-like glutamine amidotransferase